MSERKVLNRYFPPDFDPKKLEENKKRFKKSKPNRKHGGYMKKKRLNIRMLYPFTIRCNGCEVYHYVGTKFNSKVEKVQNESYLGIPIWRFYGRCTQCGNTIIFKTDPKSGDYILESGAKRNFVTSIEETTKKTYENDIESKVINSLLESRSLEELEILKTLNKRLMNREVTELNALKHLLEHNDTECSPEVLFTKKNDQISNDFENVILDKERHLITHSVKKCLDCYEGNIIRGKPEDCVLGSSNLDIPNLAVKVKENNSTAAFFNCYDSESEQDRI